MDELQKLYDAVSKHYDIGDLETFKSKMATPEQRRSFYDKISSEGFDLGSYEVYETRLGKPTGVSAQSSVDTSSQLGGPEQNTDQPQQSQTEQNGTTSGPGLADQLRRANAIAREYEVGAQYYDLDQLPGYDTIVGAVDANGVPLNPLRVNQQTGEQFNVIQPVEVNREEAVASNEAIKQAELTAGDKALNSIQNMWTHVKGLPAKTAILFDQNARFDASRFLTLYGATQLAGTNPDELRDNAYAYLDQLGEEMKATGSIVDGFNNNDIGEFAAGIFNATTSLLSSMAIGSTTGGAGTVLDMVGGGVYDYNTKKAEALGISTEELFKQGKGDDIAPYIINSAAAGLERVGFKGVTSAINRNLTGSAVRKVGLFAFDSSKESGTEWLQEGLTAYNEVIASGGTHGQAIEAMGKTMASERGIEAALGGFFGAAAAAGGGRAIKGLVGKVAKQKATTAQETIQQIAQDYVNNTDPQVRQTLIDAAVDASDQMLQATNESKKALENLTPESREKVMDAQSSIDQVDETIAKGNLSDATLKALEERKTSLQSEIDETIKEDSKSKDEQPNGTKNAINTANESNIEEGGEVSNQGGEVSPVGEQAQQAQEVVNEGASQESATVEEEQIDDIERRRQEELKLAGGTLLWNNYGNEELENWIVGEKTKTRGGEDAVVLRRINVEAEDGKTYSKEYADKNDIKYHPNNISTFTQIVPISELHDFINAKYDELATLNKESPQNQNVAIEPEQVEDLTTLNGISIAKKAALNKIGPRPSKELGTDVREKWLDKKIEIEEHYDDLYNKLKESQSESVKNINESRVNTGFTSFSSKEGEQNFETVFEDGAKSFGRIDGNHAYIVGINSPKNEDGPVRGSKTYPRVLSELSQQDVETVTINIQSSDSRKALESLLKRGILINPRNETGVSTDRHPSTFDIDKKALQEYLNQPLPQEAQQNQNVDVEQNEVVTEAVSEDIPSTEQTPIQEEIIDSTPVSVNTEQTNDVQENTIQENEQTEVRTEAVEESTTSEEVAMPPREQTNPKLKRLLKALPRQDVESMRGPANVGYRQDVIETVTGKRPTKKDAGINNVKSVLNEYFGLENASSEAAQNEAIRNWANAERTEFANPDEAVRYQAENTDNPDDILRMYDQEQPVFNEREFRISEYLGDGKINIRDFNSYGDVNNMTKEIAKGRISEDNSGLNLDTAAQELSDQLGYEITPDEIVDFVTNYPTLESYNESTVSDNQRLLQDRYKELTGRRLTESALNRFRNREARNVTDAELISSDPNMQELGVTPENVSDRQQMEASEGLSPTQAPLPKSLLKGVSDRLKLTGLAKSVKLMSSKEIESDLSSRGMVQFQTDSLELSKIESDAKGNGSWMKAPNGKKSNLNEKQWVLVRTKAFKDWFGDWENNPENSSKVIDTNGEPMVVYHGTNGNFTVFDPSKIGINANAEGPGFYFTNDKNTAQGYQNTNKDNPNLFEVFLNIKNPINLNESNFKKQEIKRIIKAVINNETAFDPEGIPDFRDSFMSNFVDTYSTTESKAIDEVADMLVEDDTKIDFIAGLGNAVGSQSLVLKSIKEALGYDATIADGYGGRGEGGGSIFVAWESNQIKSTTNNTGGFDGTNPDIRFQGQNSGNVVNGYVDAQGNIVINSELAGLDTPIHEFGHIWERVVEKENPELHARGMELIQSPEGQPYVDHVRQTQPHLEGNALYKEALAQAIGDSGARLISGQQRSVIKEWLKAAWDYIATRAGISSMTANQISNLTLREFTDAVAVDLLSGKPYVRMPNNDILMATTAKSESGMNDRQKFMSDFMLRMKAKNGVSFQGSIDGSLSPQDMLDLITFFKYATEEGQITGIQDARDAAKAMGINSPAEVDMAYKLSQAVPEGATGFKKDQVSAETLKNTDYEKMSDEEYRNLGRQLVESGQVNPQNLTNEIIANPRALQPWEVTALAYYRSQIDSQKADIAELIDSGDQKAIDSYTFEVVEGENLTGYKALAAQADLLNRRQFDLEVAMLTTANQQSAAFRLRSLMSDKDFNIVSYLAEMNATGYVNAELEAKLKSLSDELNAVRAKLKAKERKADKAIDDIANGNINEEAGRPVKPRKVRTKKETVDAVVSVLDTIDINSFGLPGMNFQTNGVIRFQVAPNSSVSQAVSDAVAKMKANVSDNVLSVSDAIEQAIQEIDSVVGSGNWDSMKFRSTIANQLVQKSVPLKVKKPYVNSQGVLVIPGEYIKDLARNGNDTIDKMVSAASAELNGSFSDYDIQNAISGYGRQSGSKRTDLDKKIAYAKRVAKLLSQVEDLQTKGKRLKTAKQVHNNTAEINTLIEQIKTLEYNIEMTPEERAQMDELKYNESRRKYLNNYIAQVQDRIDNRDFAPQRHENRYEDDAETRALRVEAERIKNEFKAEKYRHELENRSPWEKRKQLAYDVLFNITRAASAGADLSAIGVQGAIFSAARPRQAAKVFKESLVKSYTEEQYEQYFAELQADPYYDVARRAGLNLQLPSFYQSVQEEQYKGSLPAYAIDRLILEPGGWLVAKASGKDVKSTKEVAKDKLNVFRSADRNYSLVLSKIRMDLFKEFLANQINKRGLDVKVDEAEVTRLAEVVNTITMASKVPGLQGKTANDIMSAIMFSARKFVATWKVLGGWVPLLVGQNRNMQLFKDAYGGIIARGLGTMFLTAAIPTGIAALMYDDDDDEPPYFYNPYFLNPKHSDFLKIKAGNTRISLFQGIDGNIVFATRELTGDYMTSSSQAVRQLNGEGFNKSRGQLAWEYISNKFAPSTAIALGFLGNDRDKQESYGRFQESFAPMWATGIKEQYENTGNVPETAVLATLGVLGLSYNNYGGAEFAKSRGTDNKKIIDLYDKSGLGAYDPGEGQRKYFDGKELTKATGKFYKEKYLPEYQKFMTEASLSNQDKLAQKVNYEIKEGVVDQFKKEAYKYAEIKSSGIYSGSNFSSFSDNGVKYKVLESQYPIKAKYIKEYMEKEAGRDKREARVEVARKLRKDGVKATDNYKTMLEDIYIYNIANKKANERLIKDSKAGRIKLIKQSEYFSEMESPDWEENAN